MLHTLIFISIVASKFDKIEHTMNNLTVAYIWGRVVEL